MNIRVFFYVLICLLYSTNIAWSVNLMLPYKGGESYKCTQGTYLDPDNQYWDAVNEVWQELFSNPTHNSTAQWEKLKYALDFGLPLNTAVVATKGGTVEFAGSNGGWGNMIRINYGTENGPSNIFGRYAHLNTISVNVGEYVKQGQVIGLSGSTGTSTGPHLHYQLENYDGQSIMPTFVDVVKYNGLPYRFESHMSGNDYNVHNNFRVGWYYDGWRGTDDLPNAGFAPYSIIFSTAYFQNGGNDVLGVPQSFVHEESLVDFSGTHPYVQDFQKYIPATYELKTYTLVMNPYVQNAQYGMWGVVFPINGQLRDYWHFKFYELGYPMCNEYLWTDNSETYTVQWFLLPSGYKTYVVYKDGQFYRSSDISIPVEEWRFEQHVIKNSGCDGECGTGGGTEPPPVTPPANPNYDFIRSTTCEHVSPNNGQYTEPVEKNSFELNDATANVFLELDNVENIQGLEFKYDWYAPSGVLWNTWTEEIGYTETNWYVHRNVDISTATEEGQWHVNVYIDNVLTATEYFMLSVPLPAPQYFFSGSTVAENWTYGSSDPNSSDYWDLQAINPRNEFSVGGAVCAFSKITNVTTDHQWKTEFYIDNSLVWTDESGWLYVGNGWNYSSATPILTNVQAGSGEIKVWLDVGNGYELLDQKYFSVVDNSADYVYAGAQICEGWENGSTDPNSSYYWDLQAVRPGIGYKEGDRVYILAQAEDVSVNHEWKMEVYYNGVYQWEHVSGWQDLNGGFWGYSNFAPYVDNVQAGSYELRVFLRTDGDFIFQDSKIFIVSELSLNDIPFSADFSASNYFGFFLEDNSQVNAGNLSSVIKDNRSCLELENSGIADASWKLQAKKVGFDFVSGIAYNGSIWLKGETTGTIYIAVEKNTDPWNNLGMWKAFNITTTWTEHDLDFTFAGGVNPSEIRFTIQFGNYQGRLWIDDINFN